MRVERLAWFVFAWSFAAQAQVPKLVDKSLPQVSGEFSDEAPVKLSADQAFNKNAPRLMFLAPQYAPDLKLSEELRLEVRLTIKNALRREGSFRVRTMGDLKFDDEALFGEASACNDDACLYEAMNQTSIGQFMRTRISAASKQGLRVVLIGHRLDWRKAYKAADFVVRADPAIGTLEEVLLRQLRHHVRRALYAIPPAPMVDGTPPAYDAAFIIMAPSGSQVRVDGDAAGEVLELGMLRLERAGGRQYTVEVSLPGHQSAKRKITLESRQALFVDLAPKREETQKKQGSTTQAETQRFGRLSVKMKVKSGADVYLDGRWIGENPLTYGRCSPGEHKVTIRHPLYYRLWRQISCAPGKTVAVAAEMLPRYGKVRVSSSTKGAGVLLDGDPVGRTPLLIDEVPSGKHTLQILDGTWQSKVVQFKMVEHRFEKFHLRVVKRFGEVLVRSKTKGITASAKGRKIRIETGQGVLKIPPGKAKVTCQARFHRSLHQYVTVRRGGSKTLVCDLQAVSARLVVSDGGQPGRLLVDGKVVARLPAEVAVEPGEHTIVIEPDSQAHQPFTQKLTIANNGVARINPVFSAMVGGLRVDSAPIGATVFLEGQPIGVTPLLRKDLAVGIFSLEVRKKGYNAYRRRVVIALDEVETVRAAELTRRGRLKVSTVEAGATIVVGGIVVGTTPLFIDDLPQGLYEISAKRDGFAGRILEVEVIDGKNDSVRFRRLVPLSLIGAAFYNRVPGGRYLLFGGLSALAAGATAKVLGTQWVQTANDTFERANTKRSTGGALEQMQAGRDQASRGQIFEGSGYALIGLGASALSWFALRFPWGDL
ncbi:MAG: PEGA domain-containing protein [Myxococcota bacterium]|nr:PEGA domain-containing protein [Myxococcota bacterium]